MDIQGLPGDIACHQIIKRLTKRVFLHFQNKILDEIRIIENYDCLKGVFLRIF